ncbi:MAG: dockerin type I repeat-containing protein [Defluviitaleaceae bacterium]|nr:dockerin type I repeat-containing protein [Defluviitaleaceae bacterium]MCL2263772.1 dockerin type I repeat-containing protein [Defluviitaleaceae bacterium]
MRTFDHIWQEYHAQGNIETQAYGRFYETHLIIGGQVIPKDSIIKKSWDGGMMMQQFAVGMAVSQRFDVTIDVSSMGGVTFPRKRLTPVTVQVQAGGELGFTGIYNFGTYYIYDAPRNGNRVEITAYDALAMKGERENVWFSNMSMAEATERAARLLGCEVDTTGISGHIGNIDLTRYSIRNVLGFIAAANGGNFIIDFENTLRLIKIEIKNFPHMRGDVNGDGTVTMIDDGVLLGQWLSGFNVDVARGRPSHIWRQILDANGDGEINQDDVSHIARYSAGAPDATLAPIGEATISINNTMRTARNTERIQLDNIIVRRGNRGEISYPRIETPPAWDGEDDGIEVENAFVITNPLMDAEQTRELYERLSSYEYIPCIAETAFIDPAIEIGDTVTIRGVQTQIMTYSMSGDMKISFGAPSSSDAFQRYQFRGTLTERIDNIENSDRRGGGNIIWLDRHPTPAEIDEMHEEYELQDGDTVAIYDPADIPIQGQLIGLHQAIDLFYAKTVPPFSALVMDFTLATNEHGDPKTIYTIGVDTGRCIVNVASIFNANNDEWTRTIVAQGIKESPNAAAIEFDGTWKDSPRGRVLVTDPAPRIYFIDAYGTLLTQIMGDDEAHPLALAFGVVSVAAVRGWLYFGNLSRAEAGIIAAYIKDDGRAYYRQFVWTRSPGTNSEDDPGSRAWLAERECDFGTQVTLPLVSISANRTNDFRVMLVAEDSSGNGYAAYTRRYLQGDSMRDTHFTATIGFNAIKLVTPINLYLVSARQISRTETVVVLPGAAVTLMNGLQGSFTLRDAQGVTIVVNSIERFSDTEILLRHGSLGAPTAGVRGSVVYTNTHATMPHRVGNIRIVHQGSQFAVMTTTLAFDLLPFPFRQCTEHFTSSVDIDVSLRKIETTAGYITERITVRPDLIANLRCVDGYLRGCTESFLAHIDITVGLRRIVGDDL